MIQPRIATRLRARHASHDAVVSSIGELVTAKHGNYLVYFPSYDYLDQVLQRFRAAYPQCRTEVQTSGMTELQRAQFISNFEAQTVQTLVAFAVLGGVFGEGIDLIGDRLIGVVVVGVGLPQICIERDLIREHFQNEHRSGFDYAYTYPGMNRVLQAVGRVIRSELDRGLVLLIDERFGHPLYRSLFPSWWHPQYISDLAQIKERATEFWTE